MEGLANNNALLFFYIVLRPTQHARCLLLIAYETIIFFLSLSHSLNFLSNANVIDFNLRKKRVDGYVSIPGAFYNDVDVDISGIGTCLETKEKRDKKKSHCCHNSLKEPKSRY